MIQHIVFDFGGVILDLDGVHTGYPDDLAVILGLPVEDAKRIWDEHKTSVMTGKETPKDFLHRMKSELHLSFDVEEGIGFWEKRNSISTDRIDWQLVGLLEKLKEKYQVHMLSDQIKLDNGASLWIDDIHKHFHTIFRSYEQGYRKPFPESYQNLLKKIDSVSTPSDVVFIDDSVANIEAANKTGINGILYVFGDRTNLIKQLRALGVLIQ
jgi:FMN phosphatase YigB (HAD superfamily)